MAVFTYLNTLNCTGAATTAGSPNLTLLATAVGTLGVVIGTKVEHANIPADTYIIGFNSTTEVVMSNNATTTGSSLIVVATNPAIINMSDIPAQTGLKVGNDIYNINGPKLFVDSHSRYGVNQNTSTVIGTMTLSATLGGIVEYNSTKVRLISYDTGSGNVPTLDTIISQGSAIGKLLGVYSALNVAPTTAGEAMPATGFILIRQWNSVSYASGVLTGIGATSTGADRAGWLEIVGVDVLAVTVNRLNKFLAFGDYFDFLGVTTDGNRTTVYQLPTNGGDMYVPGVEVETEISDVYEFYPNAGSQTALDTKIATDAIRGRWCWISPSGLVSFGYDGTNSSGGYCPPAGRKIRVPNLFFQCCLATGLTVNTTPHTTLASRMEFAVTGGGYIEMDKVSINWYLNFNQPYDVLLSNTFIFDNLTLNECASPIDWYNVGIGQSGLLSNFGLVFNYNFAGGTMDKCVWTRSVMTSSGNYVKSISYINGFTFTNERNHQIHGNRGNTATGCMTLTYSDDCIWTDCLFGGGKSFISYCSDLLFTNTTYYDHPATTTAIVMGGYMFEFSYSNYCKIDGVNFGGLRMCQPVNGIFSAGTFSSYITCRNLGTYDEPLDLGDVRQDDVTWSRVATVATITKINHGLKTGDRVFVPVSSSATTITLAIKVLTGVLDPDTFTFVCINSGPTSGTISYFPVVSLYLFIVATAANNILVQRCFVPHTATNLFTADNSVKNLRIDNVISDYLNPFLTAALNLNMRSVSGNPLLTPQVSVYGTHRLDVFNADVTTNLTDLSWQRVTTVCTVTCVDHKLRTGLFININVSSDKNAVPLGTKVITVINSYTFTFTCLNIGDESGTLSFRTVVDRISLLMNEASNETADQVIDMTGTAAFTSAGGLVLPTLGDSVTFDSPTYRYGHAGFPIQEVIMAGGIISNFNLWYAIDKNDGNGYSQEKNLYYTRHVVPLTINAVATTYTNIIRISSTKFLVVSGRATYLSACVVNIVDGDLEPGIEVIFNAITTTYITVARLSDTQAICAFVAGGFLQTCTLNISGDTVTAGPTLTVNSAATTWVAICRLTETQAIVAYSEATMGKACTLNISGTDITNGTPLSLSSTAATTYTSITRMSDTQAIVVQESTLNDSECFTLNVSGTDLTQGISILPVVGTVTYCAVTAVSSSMAVMCCVNAGFIWACTLSVSGTDLTNGSVIQVTDATSAYTALEMISSTQVLLSYRASTTFLSACTLNISGTDLTVGAEKSISTAAVTFNAMALVSPSQAIIAYTGYGTYLQVRRLDITGTNVDCRAGGEPGGYTFSIANDDTNVAVGDYVWGTNVGGNAKIVDITDGVITVDEPHTNTLFGVLRFNHIRNEVVTNDGFKLKIKITSIVNGYSTAITALSVYTDSDDTSRARLYPLDEFNLSFTGLQIGTKIAIREAGTENLLDIIESSDGSAVYVYEEAGDSVDIVILAPGYLFQRITNYTLANTDVSIPISQNIDYGYDSEASETVTFDGVNKRIICDVGTTTISVVGIYSFWVDWALTGENLQYKSAFSEVGGNTIDAGAGTSVPVYAFLLNGWQISPDEANHTLAVTDGIILVEGGGDPFANTVGAYVVRINYQQPVQAIMVSGSGGDPWATDLSSYNTAGTAGKKLKDGLTTSKFLGLK
jgi:hypothetical protein